MSIEPGELVGGISLRAVRESDLSYFFDHQRDPVAIRMAAFTASDPDDREVFDRHWKSILQNEAIRKRTIVKGHRVVGNIACYEMFGELTIGYWIDRDFWGQGIATRALELFLVEIPERPLFARAVFDNVGSINVLERNRFVRVGQGTDFAAGRKADVLEYVYRLD